MDNKHTLPVLCTMLLIGGMVGAAELLGNGEIIFPEIAAIATGAVVAPRLAWRTDGWHILAGIALCAALGLGIVWGMLGPVWMQMSAAYLLASAAAFCLRTGFAPMISAAVLPVMLQTRSPIYLAAACGLTVAVLLVRRGLVKAGIREDTPFSPLPLPDRRTLVQTVLRQIIVTVVIWAALRADVRFACAPPLLVAFTEFWRPGAVSRERPGAVIALVTLCAAGGAVIRLIVCMTLGLPAALAAALTMLAVFGIMRAVGLMLPPAAAIAVLAYLIPADAVGTFPLQILLGIAMLVGASYLYSERAVRAGKRLVRALHHG